jgi:hypothetical protein
VTKYFTVSVVLYVVMLLSSLSGFYFVEAAGRRILLVRQTTLFYKIPEAILTALLKVPGVIILTFILLLMGIMGCIKSTGAMWFSVVCIFIWYIYTSLSSQHPVEQ